MGNISSYGGAVYNGIYEKWIILSNNFHRLAANHENRDSDAHNKHIQSQVNSLTNAHVYIWEYIDEEMLDVGNVAEKKKLACFICYTDRLTLDKCGALFLAFTNIDLLNRLCYSYEHLLYTTASN